MCTELKFSLYSELTALDNDLYIFKDQRTKRDSLFHENDQNIIWVFLNML